MWRCRGLSWWLALVALALRASWGRGGLAVVEIRWHWWWGGGVHWWCGGRRRVAFVVVVVALVVVEAALRHCGGVAASSALVEIMVELSGWSWGLSALVVEGAVVVDIGGGVVEEVGACR